MRGVQGELHKLEREEREIKAKEHELEKQVEENWGEKLVHEVEANPNVQHLKNEVEENEQKIFEQISTIGEAIMNNI